MIDYDKYQSNDSPEILMVMIMILRWFKSWLTWASIKDNGNDFDEFGDGGDEDEYDDEKPDSVEPPSPSSAPLPRQHWLDLQIMIMSLMIIMDR